MCFISRLNKRSHPARCVLQPIFFCYPACQYKKIKKLRTCLVPSASTPVQNGGVSFSPWTKQFFLLLCNNTRVYGNKISRPKIRNIVPTKSRILRRFLFFSKFLIFLYDTWCTVVDAIFFFSYFPYFFVCSFEHTHN